MTSRNNHETPHDAGIGGVTLTEGFRLVLDRLGADHPALMGGGASAPWLDPDHD